MLAMEYLDFVQRLDEALQAKEFTIWRNVQISTDREVAILATKVNWNIVRVPIYLVVDYVRAPYSEDLRSLFEEGLDYSKKAFSGGSAKVLLSSFAVVPLLVCDTALPQTIEWVETKQYLWKLHLKYWHHGFDVYPVLYCLPTGKFYYWKGWTFIASAVWPYSRRVIESVIIPGVSV